MGCANSSLQYEAHWPEAKEQRGMETRPAIRTKPRGSFFFSHKQQATDLRQQRNTRDDFDFRPDPDPNRVSPEGHTDGWYWKNKPVGLMSCAGCDLFGIDVTLPDGRAVRLEGLSQTDSILDTKREVFKKGQLPFEQLDDFILVYYGCWMGDEFMLNAFGIPWNGTQLLLRSKVQMQREAAAELQHGTCT
eukprot:TRINITY_DN10427_c0_g1_i2.p1 TRINITY_DN10427_c0_g1~~TRINITY_DN10427_c0_g1_i2.p1  ORF type:complete len:190 (+),score=23.15 TRINITY_DN10427_c0_g1_i2:126-695(+)